MSVFTYIYIYLCLYSIYASLQKSNLTLSRSKYILLYNHYDNRVHSRPNTSTLRLQDLWTIMWPWTRKLATEYLSMNIKNVLCGLCPCQPRIHTHTHTHTLSLNPTHTRTEKWAAQHWVWFCVSLQQKPELESISAAALQSSRTCRTTF